MNAVMTIEDAISEWAINYQPLPKYGSQSTPEDVGKALKAIRDERLYRENFSDFYVYCARRFGMKPAVVDGYISVADGIPLCSVVDYSDVEESAGRYIYFIEGGGMIKIGITNDVNSRFNSIRTMSPVSLSLMGFISGDITIEAQLHRRFHQYRRHGEWFTDCQEIRSYLAEVLR